MEKKIAPNFLVALLMCILVSEVTVQVAEAGVCESPSGRFKGPCMSDTNCANICIGEGWTGGHCDGLRRRCMCQKPCDV